MATITEILSTDIIGNSRADLNTNFDNLNTDKAEIASPTFTGTVTTPAIVLSSETASTIASLDASKNVKSLAVSTYPSLTELSYVKGVTSAIQTQITAKAPSTAPTFATSITGSYLTPSEILGTGASKEIVSLPVATYPSLTELSYVKGVTSAIQTQLNNSTPFGFYTASDTLIASADTEESGTNSSAELKKSFTILYSGVYRITFDLKTSAQSVGGRIYKNGAVYGTDRTTSNTNYQTFSEDLRFYSGDIIELYVNARTGEGQTWSIRNFRLYGTKNTSNIIVN